MKIVSQHSESLTQAAAILNRGGLIAFATETVYGIGCRCDNSEAIERMRAAKGRDADKPFQTLIPHREWAERYAGSLTNQARNIMALFFPGPLTLVLPGLQAGTTVGLRVPDSPWLVELMRNIDCGIAASSANISGETPATSSQEAFNLIGQKVELVIDGGHCREGVASTVASLLEDKIQIIREGAITIEQLRLAAEG